jgi:hypothetical protein
MPKNREVFLVGSAPRRQDGLGPAFDARKFLATTGGALGTAAPRISDGDQAGWWGAMAAALITNPHVRLVGVKQMAGHIAMTMSTYKLAVDPSQLKLGPYDYAKVAAKSYEAFRELRDSGVIAPGTRMQVTLPSAVISVLQILAPWQDLAPAAERAIKEQVDGIVAAIPHDDLTIQFDVAAEIVINECRDRPDEADSEIMQAKIGYPDTWEDAAASVAREAAMVPADVELGFHFCYGNPTGKHVIEPEDMSKMTRLFNMIAARTERKIDYVHMPVPISRDDEAYFAPLAELDRRTTQLYLGLVHPVEGVEGALRRMAAARATVDDFGIATECGMSAQPADKYEQILALHREIAAL